MYVFIGKVPCVPFRSIRSPIIYKNNNKSLELVYPREYI